MQPPGRRVAGDGMRCIDEGLRRTARAAYALIGVALLVAACGGGPSSSGSGGSPNPGGTTGSPSAVAYSACMRSHGVPNFPDPDSNGTLQKTNAQLLGVSSSAFDAAQRACQPLYPNNGGSLKDSLRQCEEALDCPQDMVQQVMTQLRKYSRCMRDHGVPNWPDPTIDSQGRPTVVVHDSELGFTTDEPQISTKMQQCQHVEDPEVPLPITEDLPPPG